MYTYSIVIPNYNKSQYLRQCIDSILNQTYKKIQVIIIDDCSTDESIDIINSYKGIKNIKIIEHEKNMGKSYTFNEGFKEATGEYVTLMGSDDYIDLDAIEQIDEFLSKNSFKVDMIYTDFYLYDNEKKTVIEGDTSKNISIEDLLFGCNLTSLCTFYSKALINNILGFDEEFSTRGQDYDFIIRALNYGKCVYLDKKLVFYRIGSNNSSGNLKLVLENYYKILIKNKDIFLKHVEENMYFCVINYYSYLIKNNNYNNFIQKVAVLGTLLALKKYKNEKMNLSVYGAGGLLESILFLCNQLNIKVKNIYDKYKVNEHILDYVIRDPDEIKVGDFSFICTTIDRKAIIDLFNSKKLKKYKDYIFFDEFYKINKGE